MDELDILLTLVENPTRRRILERIVREPSYPLQLSKELGVSTQAVMKNLTLMEQYGMVERTEVRSDMGPNRFLYTPRSQFTLVVDMRQHAFSARLTIPEGSDDAEDANTARLKEIDRRLDEIDCERSDLLREREHIVQSMGVAEEENIVADEDSAEEITINGGVRHGI